MSKDDILNSNWIVVMESVEFGREEFPRDNYDEALETYRNLIKSAESQTDGVKRRVSLVLQYKEVA
jgi:hypothetical protein